MCLQKGPPLYLGNRPTYEIIWKELGSTQTALGSCSTTLIGAEAFSQLIWKWGWHKYETIYGGKATFNWNNTPSLLVEGDNNNTPFNKPPHNTKRCTKQRDLCFHATSSLGLPLPLYNLLKVGLLYGKKNRSVLFIFKKKASTNFYNHLLPLL